MIWMFVENIKESLNFLFVFFSPRFSNFHCRLYKFSMNCQIYVFLLQLHNNLIFEIEKYNIDIFSSKSDFFESLFL